MFLVLGILCLTYYILLCIVLRKWNSTFSRFWLVTGILMILCWRLASSFEVLEMVWEILTCFMLLFIVTEGIIVTGMFPRTRKEVSCLIVLGAQVKGRSITDSLKRRLDKAQEYLVRHPDTRVIVSGGKGKGEEVSEAEAMAGYLISCGIEQNRIILEDQSRTTKENLKLSSQYIECMEDEIGIVSNNFHMYRALRYARKLGYQHPCPIAASCHPVLLLNYMTREFFAVWKMWILS